MRQPVFEIGDAGGMFLLLARDDGAAAQIIETEQRCRDDGDNQHNQPAECAGGGNRLLDRRQNMDRPAVWQRLTSRDIVGRAVEALR